MKEHRLQGAALFGVLLVSLLVRCYDLGGESLWLDEMFSLKLSRLSAGGILDECARDVHPPLYFLMLKPWIALFGASESALRAPSVIFGVLSVFFLFLAGKRLFGAETGLLAALLLGLSVFNVHYSQEGRDYGLMAFLTAASFHFLLLFLSRPRAAPLIAYGAAAALLPYTHFLGALVPFSQACFLVFRLRLNRNAGEKRPEIPLLAAIVTAALLFLPWASVLKRQIASASADFWIPCPAPWRVGVTFIEFSGPLPLLPVFLGLAYTAVRRSRGAGATALLLCWLFVPLAAAYVISLVFVPVYANKALIGSSLAFTLLAARGLSGVRAPRLKLAALLFLVIGSASGLYDYYHKVNKDPWRRAAADLKGRITDNDAVLFYAGYLRESFEHYYGPIPGRVLQTPFAGGPLTRAQVLATLDSLPASGRVWLVLSCTDGFETLIRGELSRARSPAEALRYTAWKFHLPAQRTCMEIERWEMKPFVSRGFQPAADEKDE